MVSMYDALVIYDGNSKYQDKIASGFKKLDDVKAVQWKNETVQDFLQEQFGWKPESLIIVDDDTVYIGKHATEHLTNRQGVPTMLSKFTKSRAEPFSTVASKLLNFTEDTDEIHGEFPIQPESKPYVDDLLSGTNIEIE